MDKKQFISVLHHFSDSSVEEAQEILSLKANFPYSQLLHALSARVSKDHGFSTQQQELQLAAVYASDRGVLKDIMTKSFTDFAAPVYSLPPVRNIEIEKAEPVKIEKAVAAEVPYVGDVADEVIHDLDRLHELKHNFEMMFINLQEGRLKEAVTVQEAAPKKEILVTGVKKESSMSKKARIVEMAKSLSSKDGEPVAEDSKPSRKKKVLPVDTLIEEIKSTKQELKPSGEKQKEQQEIIDQFIKTQPSISNTKEKIAATPVGDLSSSIKSGEFSDNIVSETLVEILIQQGKKDKAIEVLKKLIWKFPQKKTYFAAQIEELKK